MSVVDKLNDLLARVPSTNLKAVELVSLDHLTLLALIVAHATEKPISIEILLAWLGFLASLHGVAYKTFAKKRDSYKPEIESEQNQQRRATTAVPAPSGDPS